MDRDYNYMDYFGRTELLVGPEAMGALSRAKVIVFGVGGVGSWCAEALVRSGINNLTIVDADVVDVSNINRQLPATVDTLGMPKVEVMRRRLLSINPDAHITAINTFYDTTTAAAFDFNDYDYVVDAIDSLSSKALLIMLATASKARLFSSMGAALKSDPLQVSVAEFWKVKGCPLARALRDRFKRQGRRPARKFKCVYSPQLLRNTREGERANGTLVHVTGLFGLTLASLVINHIIEQHR